MKKISLQTEATKLLADICTPVGIYLRLRDKYRDTILLESADSKAAENSYSFIGINAIAGIELINENTLEFKLPNQETQKIKLANKQDLPTALWNFMQRFEAISNTTNKETRYAQGLFGYCNYNAVQYFDTIELSQTLPSNQTIAPVRYRLYQYVMVFNHFKDELTICENKIAGVESEVETLKKIIFSKDVPSYPFKLNGEETSNCTDEEYIDMVQKGIASCLRGDVFQMVLSRKFSVPFIGDEFNVYRGLRSINPSPYLFYFDYGNYKLMGSSPESQIILQNNIATVHPIAGTAKRTGDDEMDKQAIENLVADAKENAEHVMLVDLARNDLSRVSKEVEVNYYKQIHQYSHVIHLVSEVQGKVAPNTNPFLVMAKTFPAGTLSGAPKYKAMQLIADYEKDARGFYAGTIGFVGFNGSCNKAIMIRTMLSKNNHLHYQAGAGVVVASKPENELQEVNNKLAALKKAIKLAEDI
jgi:anthranilate synthase component 1